MFFRARHLRKYFPDTDIKIIALNPNAYKVEAGEGTAESFLLMPHVPSPKIKVTAVNKASGEVPLTEAEIVVEWRPWIERT